MQAGRRYALTILLRDPAALTAGFMLGVSSGTAPAGELRAVDERSEVRGARARQTRAGYLPTVPGEARWELVWTAPATIEAPIRFDLWGNAGNDDLSPLGDRVYYRTRELSGAP